MRQEVLDNWDIGLRLCDLSAGQYIVAICGACGHRHPIDKRQLQKRYGDKARLLKLEMGLRCSRCTVRLAGRIVLMWHPR